MSLASQGTKYVPKNSAYELRKVDNGRIGCPRVANLPENNRRITSGEREARAEAHVVGCRFRAWAVIREDGGDGV